MRLSMENSMMTGVSAFCAFVLSAKDMDNWTFYALVFVVTVLLLLVGERQTVPALRTLHGLIVNGVAWGLVVWMSSWTIGV